MPIKITILFLSTALISFILTGFAGNIFLRLNILNTNKIPLAGGISMGLAFIVSGFVSHAAGNGVILSALLMLIFGIIDDWRELSVATKLVTQLICTSILVYSGVRTHIIFIGDFFNILVTFIWVIGITNAMNHLDIQDGLAAGVGMIICVAFSALSFFGGDIKSLVFALILLASLIGFIPYNLPRARIYMGNSGSHFLGFVLSIAALNIGYATLERKFALFSPLFILGFPILDTLFLIIIRIRKGRSALLKSNDHLVLRLLKKGYSKNRALLVILSLTFFFALSGVLIARVPNFISACFLGVLALMSLSVFTVMGRVTIDD